MGGFFGSIVFILIAIGFGVTFFRVGINLICIFLFACVVGTIMGVLGFDNFMYSFVVMIFRALWNLFYAAVLL